MAPEAPIIPELYGSKYPWVLAAATPWSDSHHGAGYQLTIELTRAEARYREGRLSVSMGLRATLRSRVGNRYIAQTQARCDQAGVTSPDRGAPVFASCTTFLGRSLASWLDGLPIAAVSETQKPTP